MTMPNMKPNAIVFIRCLHRIRQGSATQPRLIDAKALDLQGTSTLWPAVCRWELVASALIGLAALSSVPAVHAVAPVGPPSISGVVIGPKELVFDTRTGCEQIDIPDAPARAFRDNHGTVHLVASHFVARAMTGPSLNRLKRDCRAIYRSPQDRDPSHFKYKNWLFSFFSEDGRRFAALVHSEFDADEIPGMCATPKDSNNCWWNTVTFARSLDGGYNFLEPAPPRNLVAALPYRYVVGNRASAYGYAGPTNIVKVDKFYYALINDSTIGRTRRSSTGPA